MNLANDQFTASLPVFQWLENASVQHVEFRRLNVRDSDVSLSSEQQPLRIPFNGSFWTISRATAVLVSSALKSF